MCSTRILAQTAVVLLLVNAGPAGAEERVTLRVSSSNLQGYDPARPQSLGPRLSGIAGKMRSFNPHLGAFQEVIAGHGVEDTSYQLGRMLNGKKSFGTYFKNCHLYRGTYPEGVSVYWRSPCVAGKPQVIDLNEGLEHGLRPQMARYAVSVPIVYQGKKVLFTSVHLDHNRVHNDPSSADRVRVAQMNKLLRELDRHFGRAFDARIIAGDLNAGPSSPVLKAAWQLGGYRDSFYGIPERERATFIGTEGNVTGQPIDYVLVAGDCKISNKGFLYCDPRLTDHKGIFADIEFR